MVEYNTVEGEVGIYADHIPMTQIIAPGRLIITERNEEKQAALLSGFVEITPEKMTILAEAVEWPQNIDVNRAKEAKTRAERRLSSEQGGVDIGRAELALREQLPRLDVAGEINFYSKTDENERTPYSPICGLGASVGCEP